MSFVNGSWNEKVDVRDFIVRNYTPYDGDDSFLAAPTERTIALWDEVKELMAEERRRGGVLEIDNKTISMVNSHGAGYIDKEKEVIVGFQTDAPLKRAIFPFGGMRTVVSSLAAYDQKVDPTVEEIFKYIDAVVG